MSHLAKDAAETITRWMPDGSGATSPVEYVRADKVAELQADVSRKQTLLDDAKNVMERQIARRKELEAQVLALQSCEVVTSERLKKAEALIHATAIHLESNWRAIDGLFLFKLLEFMGKPADYVLGGPPAAPLPDAQSLGQYTSGKPRELTSDELAIVEEGKKYERLSGRGMHELRLDELPGYLMWVADNYADGPHMEGHYGAVRLSLLRAVSWVVAELERKTNDERVVASQLANVRAQKL